MKEFIVYLSVNFIAGKKDNEVIISKTDYYDVLVYIDHYNMVDANRTLITIARYCFLPFDLCSY